MHSVKWEVMLWTRQLLTTSNLITLVGVIIESKKAIGVATRPSSGDGKVYIKGRDLLKGVPKVVINQRQIAEALEEPVLAIIEAVNMKIQIQS